MNGKETFIKQKMKNKGLVSIIVPVYNSEKYLKYCLNSIVNQTYKNIEIILIDDESRDSSGIICDKYSELYDNIIIIHQKNAGCGFARNTGLDIMNGEYYTFIDADDYVSSHYVEDMVEVVERYGADMVTSGTLYMLETRNEKKYCEGTIEVIDVSNNEIYKNKYIKAPSWGKLYRSSKTGNVRYDRASYEDVPYAELLKPYVSKVVMYNKLLYVYRAYQDSITRGNFGKNILLNIHKLYHELDQKDSAGIESWMETAYDSLSIVKYRSQEILYKKILSMIIDDINNIPQRETDLYKKLSTLSNELSNKINCSQIKYLKIVLRHMINLCCSRIKVLIRYNVKVD